MLTAAMLLLLAADPGPAEERLALFTAPLVPVLGGVLGIVASQPATVFVPLGAGFTALDVEWIVEGMLVHQRPAPDNSLLRPANAIGQVGHYGTWLSAGPVIHSGLRALNGFFLSPRFTLGAFFIGDGTMMVDVLLGLDAGYQATLGNCYLAFAFGASVGVGSNDNDAWAGPLVELNRPAAQGTFGVVGGVNLQLLRVGYVF